MGDVRFLEPYRRLRDAVDPLAALHELSDEEVIQALAAAPRREDPYLVNVLATEAMNRTRRATTINRTLGEGVVALDSAGRVTYLNPAAEQMLQRSPGEMRYRQFHASVHVGDVEGQPVPAERCAIRRAIDHGETVRNHEGTFLRADGTRFPVETTASPVLREGEPMGAILVFRDITARKRAERALRDRLALEETIAKISARFVEQQDMDEAMDAALADLGRTAGASRTYLFQLRPGGKLIDNTHEWCTPGVTPMKEYLQGLSTETYRWSIDWLRRGDPLVVEDVNALPPEAAVERETFQDQGIRSLAIFPVHVGGRFAGFLGFDEVENTGAWHAGDLALLKVASGILGAALERHRGLQKLRLRDFSLDRSGEAIYLVDRSGQILYANRTACDQLGYPREELTRMTVHQISPDLWDKDWDAEWEKVRARAPVTMEKLHRHADGTLVPVELRISHLQFEGHPYHIAFARDITERKRAEKRLRESEQRYRSLFKYNPDAVFCLDRSGRFMAANDACERLSGYAPTELVDRPFDPLVAPEDQLRVRQHFGRATEGEPQRIRFHVAHKRGHHVDAHVTAVPVVIDGRVAGVFGIAREAAREAA